jgi:hypothetical protein
MNLPSIRDLWIPLGLPGAAPRDKLDITCPFAARHNHGDRRPSFALLADGMAFKCHGCSASGGVLSFVGEVLGCDRSEAARWIRERIPGDHPLPLRPPSPSRASRQRPPAAIEYPFRKMPASDDLRNRVARSRRIPVAAVATAESWGLLTFAKACGVPAWVLSDGENRVFEARPVDGGMFAATAQLPERKTHARCNPSGKAWPLGTLRLPSFPDAPVLFAEGSGDFLAAVAVCDGDIAVPVALLGGLPIHNLALPRFAGRRIFIATHRDRAGSAAALRWAEQLRSVDCTVRGLVFDDGDLTDQIAEGSISEIRNYLIT